MQKDNYFFVYESKYTPMTEMHFYEIQHDNS